MTITSPHNQKLKEIRKLRGRRRWRERSGRFVAEGEDLLAAADAAGWEAVERYCAAGSGLPGVEVEPELLAAGLGTGVGHAGAGGLRGALGAVAARAAVRLPARRPRPRQRRRGAALRARVRRLVGRARPGSADPFGPKAVRASMGAVFAVPLARAQDAAALPGAKIALASGRGEPLAAIDASPETTLLIGSEREGLPEDVIARADRVAHIPIETDSLNAAMAATIALYEVAG